MSFPRICETQFRNPSIKSCMKVIDNEHLVYCRELNGKNEINYEYVLNRSMQQKVEVLNQVKLNEKKRMKEKEPL